MPLTTTSLANVYDEARMTNRGIDRFTPRQERIADTVLGAEQSRLQLQPATPHQAPENG